MSFRVSIVTAAFDIEHMREKFKYVICRTNNNFLFHFTKMESEMWGCPQLAQCEVYFHIGQHKVLSRSYYLIQQGVPDLSWPLQVVLNFPVGILLLQFAG